MRLVAYDVTRMPEEKSALPDGVGEPLGRGLDVRQNIGFEDSKASSVCGTFVLAKGGRCGRGGWR